MAVFLLTALEERLAQGKWSLSIYSVTGWVPEEDKD